MFLRTLFKQAQQPLQTTAYYILSLLIVYDVDFPGGLTTDNVKWRAVVWAVSEFFLVVAVALNHLPRAYLSLRSFRLLSIL